MNDSKEKTHTSLRVPLARPWFDDGEPAVARDVVQSRWLIFGPKVEEFERRFAAMVGARFGIAVNSGSSALLVAMSALGVGPGDEIVAPDMTFVSTASAALFLGAVPRFCDIDRVYYGMAAEALERRITPRTKLIVPVHYAGQSCEMAPILEIARRRGIPVLEDSAESHLARYSGAQNQGVPRFTGTLGAAGIFSFTPSKPMTTGEGGMIVTDDAGVAERCRLLRNFGDRGKFEWQDLGFNFRMPEVMGAIGLVQLAKLEEAVRRRRALAARYRERLSGCSLLTLPAERTPEDANYQLFTIVLDVDRLTVTRDEVISALWELGVSTRLYYPALHRAGVFARFGPYDDREYPNTMWYARRALSLPLFPSLTGEEQDLVVDRLLDVIARFTR
ncbi:MAG: DegT/DnrJ/EryC1/StrS family aminotransferase [Myxococcales bacterium]|nr:DegT/DnrJ/EryC1/StrS family aminotransferase [Myxococcales bacterium]